MLFLSDEPFLEQNDNHDPDTCEQGIKYTEISN